MATLHERSIVWKRLTKQIRQLPIIWKFISINAIILIFFVILILASNRIFTDNMRKETSDSNIRYVQYVSEIINSNLESVDNLHYQFYANDDLTYLKSQTIYDGECIVRMMRLKTTLTVFNMVTPISSDVCLYFDKLGMVLNKDGTCRVDQSFQSAVEDYIKQQKSYYSIYKGYIGINSGKSTYTMRPSLDGEAPNYYFIFDLSDENYRIALFITLNTSEINTLIQSANYNENSIFFILDKDKRSIAGDVRNIDRNSIDSDPIDIARFVSEIYNSRSEVAKKYIITEKTQNAGQLTYLALYPYSAIEATIRQQDAVFIEFYIAVILLEFTGMVFYFMIFILPVKMLFKRLNIKERNFDEIKAIGTAYTKLNEEVQVNNQKISMQNDMLFELWLNRIANHTVTEEDAGYAEYIGKFGGYCTICIAAISDGLPNAFSDSIMTSLGTSFEIYNIASDHSRTIYLLIGCACLTDYNTVVESVKTLMCIQHGPVNCVAGVSSFKTDIRMLHTAVTESSDALLQHSEIKAGAVLIFGRTEERTATSFRITIKDENRLMRAILNNDMPKLEELLSEQFNPNHSLIYQRQALGYLMSMRDIIMNSMSIEVSQILEQSGLPGERAAEDFFVLDEIRQYVLQQLSALAGIVNEKNTFSSSKLLEYVQRNYNKVISLDTIAEEFSFSTAYLSRYFKKLTGENFIVYVNRLRMEKAKELLESTDMLLKDISRETGFNDIKYFIKAFKQYEGITPGEYRQIRR